MNETEVETLEALMLEVYTTTTMEDVLLAAFHSPRIDDQAVHEARKRVQKKYQ